MIDPDLEDELNMANEFVLEALKAEKSDDQMEFSLVPQSSKHSYSAGLEPYGFCLENDLGYFFQSKNEDQSLSTLDPMPNELDKKDLFGYSATDQSSYHLVPDICANQNTSICYEKKRCGPLWNTKNSFFPRQAVGCLIKSETSTSCYFPLPNLINGMNKIELLDTGIHHTIPNELSFNVKIEPMEQEVRVDFLNLKDVYFKQDLSSDQYENPDKIEDSILYMRLIPRCKVNGVKVYLKEFHDDVSIQRSEGPILLPSEYNRHRGILSVDFNSLSMCLPQRYGSGCHLEETILWQLVIKVQLDDGKSACHFSKSFQIRTRIEKYADDEIEFLRQIPITHIESTTINSSIPCSVKMEDSKPKFSCEWQDLHPRANNLQSIPCRNNLFSDEATSDTETFESKTVISLVPGSTLDMSTISSKLKEENDIISIQEQANFSGLLKVMKTSQLKDTSRRKANGYRSAEEVFVWACGHCFFSRGKKSTVKSHVSRQVCQKRRRLISESQIKEKKKVKPKFRRCHTFNGIQSKPMRNYNLKRCKTP